MKRLVAVIPLLLSVALSSAEEPAGLEGVTYLPRTFYVGDVVEMRVELPRISQEEIIIPQGLPKARWFLFRRIAVKQGAEGSILSIFFSSYQPGIRLMPPLNLGALVLTDIRVDTASLLAGEKRGLAGTAGPLFLPNTGFYYALVVGILFGGPLGLIFLIKGIRKQVAHALFTARRRHPYRRLSRVLKELDQTILNHNGNLFYTTLTEELKRYISLRSGREFKTLTGRETGIVLKDFCQGESFLLPLQELFRFADEVKFGDYYPRATRKQNDLKTVEVALEGLEGYYRRLWEGQTKREVPSDVDR